MAQRLAELCILLVEKAHGALAAKVFSTLALYGRLSLLSLRQYSNLPLRRIKVGLTTLIQHHLILYYSANEDEPTFFQVDWTTSYALARVQKIVNVVNDSEGEAAAQIVSNILQLGHARIGDLAEGFDLGSEPKRDSGIDTNANGLVNGGSKQNQSNFISEDDTSAPDFYTVVRNLLKKGFLLKVNERTHIPHLDLQDAIKDTVIEEHFPDGKITGSKKEKAFRNEVNALKRKWEGENAYSEPRDLSSHGKIKRSKFPQSSSKRLKTNEKCNGINHHPAEDDDDGVEYRGDKLPNHMIVKVNLTKCNILFRNQRLQQMVHRFLGPATASVYRALLLAVQSKQKELDRADCDDADALENGDEEIHEKNMVSVTDRDVFEHLPRTVHLGFKAKALQSPKQINGFPKPRNKTHIVVDDEDTTTNGIKIDSPSDSAHEHRALDEDYLSPLSPVSPIKELNQRLHFIATHLDILAEHPKGFCVREIGSTKTELDITSNVKILIGLELEKMIDARCGKIPIRLIRILREIGKTDELQVAEMIMLNVKDTSAWLTSLQFAGLAHSQELAKDNTHKTVGATFLWWFDEETVRSVFLEQTYQAMSRALQRLQHERETRFKAAIDKSERVDVRGREHELLNLQDKEELRKWQEVEDQLLVQVERLDDLVAVLRDFAGNETFLTT